MTVKELAAACGFDVACGEGDREVTGGIYCCDLLSIVMGRAPADCAWVTVMGNLNSIAVSVLADTACIVLAEGMALDDDARARGEQQGGHRAENLPAGVPGIHGGGKSHWDITIAVFYHKLYGEYHGVYIPF